MHITLHYTAIELNGVVNMTQPIATSSPSNAELFVAASKHIPGGVNSPVRAFKGVGGTPVFITKANGAYLWDAMGKQYIDYVGSWGPMILGHAHTDIVQAVQLAAEDGLSFGAPTPSETTLADLI